ncbi:MAG: phosphatidate cytidylyltransferase [Clostridia bacterium]|nr:phosphatidate cytidylyltransferase [Clostridia bacterium]
MLTRIVTALVATAVFLPVLYFSHTPVFAAVLALLSLIAVLEMLRCVGLWRKWALTVPSCLAAAALPLLPYWLGRAQIEQIVLLTAFALVLYFFAVMTFSRGSIKLQDAAIAFFTTFYVICCFTALSTLRYGVTAGNYVYLICFIGAWVTDTFAYFTGFLVGKHKLIPDVSPQKTVEGSIGGIVFCIASMLLYGYIISVITKGALTPNYLLLGVSGVAVSVVSQVGDLVMSAIKRQYGIKDYGKLFPGHGGVLDRFDSVLAVALVLLLITPFGNLFA